MLSRFAGIKYVREISSRGVEKKMTHGLVRNHHDMVRMAHKEGDVTHTDERMEGNVGNNRFFYWNFTCALMPCEN